MGCYALKTVANIIVLLLCARLLIGEEVIFHIDTNHHDFCEIILIFKADFRIMISNVKITANDDFKMVPDKITGVTLTSTPVIPDHW